MMSQSMFDERLEVLRGKADALERELGRSREALAAIQRLISKAEYQLRMRQKGEEDGSS